MNTLLFLDQTIAEPRWQKDCDSKMAQRQVLAGPQGCGSIHPFFLLVHTVCRRGRTPSYRSKRHPDQPFSALLGSQRSQEAM